MPRGSSHNWCSLQTRSKILRGRRTLWDEVIVGGRKGRRRRWQHIIEIKRFGHEVEGSRSSRDHGRGHGHSRNLHIVCGCGCGGGSIIVEDDSHTTSVVLVDHLVDHGGLVHGVGDDVLDDGAAVEVHLELLVHPVLEEFHGRVVAPSHAAAVLGLFGPAAAPVLARVEVGAAQVRGGVVVGAVRLAGAARLAVGQECPRGRGVLADPDAADRRVVAVHVPAQLVVAVKALGLVVAEPAKGRLAERRLANGPRDLGLVLDRAVLGLDRDDLGLGDVDVVGEAGRRRFVVAAAPHLRRDPS